LERAGLYPWGAARLHAHKFFTSTNKWSDLDDSDPIKDVQTAKNAIMSKAGKMANTILIPYASLQDLMVNDSIIDRLKYTTSNSVGLQDLGNLFGIQNVLIGSESYLTDADVVTDIWTDTVVVAYVPELPAEGVRSWLEPHYGFTLRFTDKQKTDTWLSPDGKISYVRYTDVYCPCLHESSVTSAYIIQDTH
jgi:hypothetical protein